MTRPRTTRTSGRRALRLTDATSVILAVALCDWPLEIPILLCLNMNNKLSNRLFYCEPKRLDLWRQGKICALRQIMNFYLESVEEKKTTRGNINLRL